MQLTADGVPVVHHDPRLGRPAVAGTPLSGRPIASLTLEALRAHELAPAIGVPTLGDVLALVDGQATVYVEVKAPAAEEIVARRLAGRERWTSVHAFDHRVPRTARARLPTLEVGVLSSSYLLDNVAPLRAVGARDLWQHWALIDAELVRAAHNAGGRVIAWTVNESADMDALTRLGVDGICTDVAAVALVVTGRR